MSDDSNQSTQVREAVYRAAGRVEVRQSIERIYADLQTQIDARKPICSTSGRCCRFDEYGHRLYVTTMELALFVYEYELRSWNTPTEAPAGGCRFQVTGLCGVHSIRPFGCRVFFCDPTSLGWQNEQYEQFHARLKRLHDDLNVHYFYMEWREALRHVGLAGQLPVAEPNFSLTMPPLPD